MCVLCDAWCSRVLMGGTDVSASINRHMLCNVRYWTVLAVVLMHVLCEVRD